MEQPNRSYFGDPELSFSDGGVFSDEMVKSHQYCHSTAYPLRAGIFSTKSHHLAAAYKGTKLRSCKKCRTSWYCSHSCQQNDWLHGHRAKCTEIGLTYSKMSEAACPEIDEYEETDTEPAFVRKAFRGMKKPNDDERFMHAGRRVAKHFSRITFEEKCTMEFLFSCGILQTMMSDTFYRRANSLPPSGADAPFTFPVHAYSDVQGFENVTGWLILAGKFKSWMWRSSNEGPGLDFLGSIPVRMRPNVHVAVRNAIELLQSWEPQESNNWAMQREATVMSNLIAGFGHQKCFVDEIMTPGAALHSYVQLLLRWAATWRGPATHTWSRMMQSLLSALLSGLELSETRHSSPCNPAKVALLEPACVKFVSILAADVSRLRVYKPTYLTKLPRLLEECPTNVERKRLLLEVENETIAFYAEAAGRELKACLRARRYFSSLNLEPLGRLAAYHKNQLLCTGAYKVGKGPLSPTDWRLYQKVLDAGLPPLIAAALLLIDQPPCKTAIIASATHCIMRRLRLSPDCLTPFATDRSLLHAQQACYLPLP
jgi:hypothetical protein